MDKVPLETGHSGLNKFISREDGNYARVLRRLIVAVKRGMPLQTEEGKESVEASMLRHVKTDSASIVEPRNLTRDQQGQMSPSGFFGGHHINFYKLA